MQKRIVFLSLILSLSLFSGINRNLSAQVLEQDSLALVALYDSTDGTNWTDNTNWLSGMVSTWYGITISGERVTRVELGNNNLVGTIPPEIGNLINLEYLNLSQNQLTGSIPVEIENLTNLQSLFLYSNQLSGSIPTVIGNLTSLMSLNLRVNQLSGTIPNEIGNLTNLRLLQLNQNKLSGSIPTVIGNLTNLILLDLHFNQLSGTIPTEIGDLTNLENLSLSQNQLKGSIPTEVGNLTNLKALYLNVNKLSGSIPAEIDSLKNLETFYLNDNQFVDLPDLSPDTSLTDLQVQDNKFTFEDIEPNISVSDFVYSPQDSVGTEQDTTVTQGSSLVLSVFVGGTANQYQWVKDGTDISGANSSSYVINSVVPSDSGSYLCRITNTIATQLTLYSRPINVTVEGAVGVVDHSTRIPKVFALHQNYPNPFNPVTVIKYDLPRASKVVLKVYNLLGQEIKTLVNEFQSPGEKMISWDGLNEQGKKVTSGIYIYRIEADSFTKSKKMIINE